MRNLILFIITLSVVIVSYLFRFDSVRPRYQEGDKVRISGMIGEEPQVFGDRQRIRLAEISFYIPRFPEFHYGDKIEVEGIVRKGERSYYLEEPEIREIREIGVVGGIETGNTLIIFREKLLGIFGKSLPSPESDLLKGLILSTKNSLDSEFFEALRKTGTLHVVVASGTNVSLFAGTFIEVLASIIKRRRAIFVGLLVVWVYVFLVGSQAPIVRAAIFATVAYIGQLFGREIGVIRVLGGIGAVMLLVNPLWLFDVGFQLSFAATFGIIWFGERILGKLGGLGRLGFPEFMRNDLATTTAAQIFVAPILIFNFGQISIISPLVNMIVLWTVPLIMFGGLIAGVLGTIWQPLGQVCMWVVYPLLWYFVEIVKLFGGLG